MWAVSGHWSGVGTFDIMHSGVPLCLALVGFSPLALVGAGGQMGTSRAGVRVYFWWWVPCFGLSVWSAGQCDILAGLAFRLSGTD